jgi:hypothetical protein
LATPQDPAAYEPQLHRMTLKCHTSKCEHRFGQLHFPSTGGVVWLNCPKCAAVNEWKNTPEGLQGRLVPKDEVDRHAPSRRW